MGRKGSQRASAPLMGILRGQGTCCSEQEDIARPGCGLPAKKSSFFGRK